MISPLNQLSVTNMAAITPIGKVKSFQFSNPNMPNMPNMNAANPQALIRSNSQGQISPAYLPPLATTPRFTVPTPRGNVNGAGQYHAINLNASPMYSALILAARLRLPRHTRG
eukprot:TRINITY_DN21757_c0_g1_i1.p1 TRINITY_DN21757_c0_g1~~TRINITY_DN21757_c0_g1_i1.p1  ORF type:complete len:113 (+),score=27.77 TRINITY_DN21757_c0_g1_i1:108-446(+)